MNHMPSSLHTSVLKKQMIYLKYYFSKVILNNINYHDYEILKVRGKTLSSDF